MQTGKQVWMHPFPKSQLFASTLATAGDLVFIGGTNDRMFRAFDAKTGKVLWEQKTNSGIMGMPVAYEVDGTEYIAIQSGWGVDAQRIQDGLSENELEVGCRRRSARRRGLGIRSEEVTTCTTRAHPVKGCARHRLSHQPVDRPRALISVLSLCFT